MYVRSENRKFTGCTAVRSEELVHPMPPLCKGRCPSAHTGAEGLTLINPLRLAMLASSPCFKGSLGCAPCHCHR